MSFWLRLTVTVALLALLVGFVDWREAAATLAGTDPVYAAAALLLCIVGIVISAVRWNVLVRAQRIPVSYSDAVRYYWIGAFIGNYLPSTFGGDVVRAIVMKRSDKLAQIGASIVVERITGLVIVLLLVVPSLVLRPEYYPAPGLLQIMWLVVAGLALATLAVVVLGGHIVRWLARIGNDEGSLLRRGIDKVRKLVESVNDYRRSPGAVFATLIWATVFYANMVVFHFVTLAAVGQNVPWLEVLLITPLIPLASFLPISLNSIGLAEGAFVFFFVQAGVPAEVALAAAILMRLAMLAATALGGFYWMRTSVPRTNRRY